MYSIKLATINVIGRPCICFPLSIKLSTSFNPCRYRSIKQVWPRNIIGHDEDVMFA